MAQTQTAPSLKTALSGGTPAPFLLLWHRMGNTAGALEAVHAARRDGAAEVSGRPLRHGVECDLKWTPGPRAAAPPHLYFFHGPTGLERLGAAEALRREAEGRVISVERALDRPDADRLDYMVEVKCGHGPREPAVAACVEAFARHGLAGRLLFAASSLAVLEDLVAAHPEVPRCLFVPRLFSSGHVLHVPAVDVVRGLLRGIVIGPTRLRRVVDAVSGLGERIVGGGGRCAGLPAQLPRARSIARALAALEAGLAGAFLYLEPEPIRPIR